MAIFLLLGGFTVVFRLFHAAMQYSSLIDAQQAKVRVAQNKLEEIRAWSRVNHQPVGSTPFSDWSHWHNTTGNDPDDPQIRWQVRAEAVTLASPCSLFEAVQTDATQRRTMPTSCRQLIVTADTGVGSKAVVLTSYVGQPSQDPVAHPCQVELSPRAPTGGGSQTLNHDQEALYTARLFSNSPRGEILDTFFHWKVDNTVGQGNGTLSGLRSGREMGFRHRIRIKEASGFRDIYAPAGRCQAKAICLYRGRLFTANTPDLDLNP